MSHASLYLIQSLDNGGVYVGVTTNARRRWNGHVSVARRGRTPLYHSMRKYGSRRHTFEVVETFATFEEALQEEAWWIAYLRGLGARIFNLTKGGEGALGFRHSAASRKRMSDRQKGRTHTLAARAKISAANKGQVMTPNQRARMAATKRGRRLTPEHRAKMAAAHKGRVHAPETRSKIAAAQKGVPRKSLSEEHRAKLLAANTGRSPSPETRAKLSASRTGHDVSEETRIKISAANKGRVHSPQARANMAAAQIARNERLRSPDGHPSGSSPSGSPST